MALLAVVVGAVGAAGGAAQASAAGGSGTAGVRAATAGYHSIDAARASGYGQLPEGTPLHYCIDEDLDLDDSDGKPAMGVHLVNGPLLDAVVDEKRPEVLVYEPTRNGGMRLVAVEYVVFEADWQATGAAAPPRLLGQAFDHVEAPNRYGLPSFYALHAWVWRHNAHGMFADMNPQVSCAYGTP
jgi:hypothetical protein